MKKRRRKKSRQGKRYSQINFVSTSLTARSGFAAAITLVIKHWVLVTLLLCVATWLFSLEVSAPCIACSLNSSFSALGSGLFVILVVFRFFLFNVSFCTRFLILRFEISVESFTYWLLTAFFWFYVIYGIWGFLRTLLIVCLSSDPMRLNCSAFSVTLEHRSKHWSD